jgi:hypothetical protein
VSVHAHDPSHQRAEIGVGANRLSIGRLFARRWLLDAARLAPTGLVSRVKAGERALREPQLVVEDVHHRAVDLDRLFHEGLDRRIHARVHRPGVGAVHGRRVAQDVVLGDIDEFYEVEQSCLVNGIRTCGLVAETDASRGTYAKGGKRTDVPK